MQPSQSSCSPASTPAVAIEELLSLLADDYVHAIVDALAAGPEPATAIADQCAASTVTIYRRLNRLESAGLVTTASTVAPDGTHRTQYRLRSASIAVSITDDGLTGSYTVEPTTEPTADRYGHRPASTAGDD
jgi:transposase